MKKLLGVLVMFSMGWMGCDSGSSEALDTKGGVELSGDVVAEQTSTDEREGEQVVQQPCANFPDLTGAAFRVLQMHATEPTDMIDDTWAADIANCDLVLVFHVISHDVASGIMEVEVTSAKATKTKKNDDGTCTPTEYQFSLEPAKFTARLDGCKFTWDGTFGLDVVTPTVNKPFHVFGLTGGGVFSEDGTKLLDCWLEGAILEEETFDLCMTVPGMSTVNFHWFMNLAHICPNYDSDNDGKIDSYRFSGHVSAERELGAFSEGINPIESLVQECKEDRNPCE